MYGTRVTSPDLAPFIHQHSDGPAVFVSRLRRLKIFLIAYPALPGWATLVSRLWRLCVAEAGASMDTLHAVNHFNSLTTTSFRRRRGFCLLRNSIRKELLQKLFVFQYQLEFGVVSFVFPALGKTFLTRIPFFHELIQRRGFLSLHIIPNTQLHVGMDI